MSLSDVSRDDSVRPVVLSDAPTWCDSEVAQRAWQIGVEFAAPHADDVDRSARFPQEAVAEIRASGLLAAMIPTEFGGGGASLADVATAVRAFAAHCSATALVFAMHQIEIWYLVECGHTPELQGLLRSVAEHGTLIANANAEVGLGGNIGQSVCAVERADGRFHLEKDALAISYGAHADAIMLTARRAPDAEPTDQVIVACRPGSFTLEQTSTWDTMGLRGTCSCGFRLTVDEDEAMILPVSWAGVANKSLGASVILLNSAWLGIAESAAATAHRYVRASARRTVGVTPATAPLLAEMAVTLTEARSVMANAVARQAAAHGTDAVDDATLILALRSLKLSMARLAIEVVAAASQICGLVGYKRDSPYSLDRHHRDITGAPLMANNLRFLGDNAQLLLVMKQI